MQSNDSEPLDKDWTEQLTDYAPAVMGCMMIVMFGLTGWMQHKFLSGTLTGIEGASFLIIVFPVVIQVLRLVTGFLSASFFKRKFWVLGVVVFLFSIWLSVYEYGEVDSMILYWTKIDVNTSAITHSATSVEITKNVVRGIMTVLIWGAVVLEFFLAFWLGKSMNEALVEKKESASNTAKAKPNSKPSASGVSSSETVGASAPVS